MQGYFTEHGDPGSLINIWNIHTQRKTHHNCQTDQCNVRSAIQMRRKYRKTVSALVMSTNISLWRLFCTLFEMRPLIERHSKSLKSQLLYHGLTHCVWSDEHEFYWVKNTRNEKENSLWLRHAFSRDLQTMILVENGEMGRLQIEYLFTSGLTRPSFWPITCVL